MVASDGLGTAKLADDKIFENREINDFFKVFGLVLRYASDKTLVSAVLERKHTYKKAARKVWAGGAS